MSDVARGTLLADLHEQKVINYVIRPSAARLSSPGNVCASHDPFVVSKDSRPTVRRCLVRTDPEVVGVGFDAVAQEPVMPCLAAVDGKPADVVSIGPMLARTRGAAAVDDIISPSRSPPSKPARRPDYPCT